MDHSHLNTLVLIFVFVLVSMVVTLFVVFYIFNKRRIHFIFEKKTQKENFKRELESSKVENQEHLLKMLSWELHDNIGQLLSVCKMQLSMIKEPLSTENSKYIEDTSLLISKILEEIRSLSKSLNAESIVFMGLLKAINFEVERMNRIGLFKSEITLEGKSFKIEHEHEIILFRIVQEIISNVIKHSKGSKFEINLSFQEKQLIITCRDNGVGMSFELINFGLGLKNIISRAHMIGAKIHFSNQTDGGLITELIYNVNLTSENLST